MNEADWEEYVPPIWVRQGCDGEWVDEKSVTHENIEEDAEGRDVLTFACRECGASHRSLRVGGSRPG